MDETYKTQPSPAEKLALEFAAAHPEVGEVVEGQPLSPDRVNALGELLNEKIKDLSRRETLNDAERAFVNQTLDMSSRVSIYWLETFGLEVGASPDTPHTLNRLRAATRALQGEGMPATPLTTEQMLADKHLLIRTLGSLTGGRVSINRLRVNRSPVEDLARSTVALMAQVAGANPGVEGQGVPVDRYIKGNLDNLMAHYQLLESETPATQ